MLVEVIVTLATGWYWLTIPLACAVCVDQRGAAQDIVLRDLDRPELEQAHDLGEDP